MAVARKKCAKPCGLRRAYFRLQLLSGLITGRYLPVDHVHTVRCFEGVSHGLWW
jgi:hypothetical protein